jgi:hypothetical protein
MARAAMLLALLMSACSGAPPHGARPEPSTPAPHASSQPSPEAGAATFPTPYTAAQIRDATRPGRAYTWRVQAMGKPAFERTVTFTHVDADGAELVSDGSLQRVSWEDLRKHAEFPHASVTTRDETVTVPAGSFDCVVYVVEDRAEGEGETSTFYFAKGLPGAPVLFFTEKGGERLMTSMLVGYEPGSGG